MTLPTDPPKTIWSKGENDSDTIDVHKEWPEWADLGMDKFNILIHDVSVMAQGCEYEKIEPHRDTTMWYFGVEAGSYTGKVHIAMRPDWSSTKGKDNVEIPPFDIQFECKPDGDAVEPRPGNVFNLSGIDLGPGNHINNDLSMAFEVYHQTKHPRDGYIWLPLVPMEVTDKWMQQLEILHIVVIPTVTWHEGVHGSRTVDRKPYSDPVPPRSQPRATGPRTARLPRLEFILDPIGMPPPMETPNGSRFTVYFDLDSHRVDKAVKRPWPDDPKSPPSHLTEEQRLKEYIESLYSRWDFAARSLRGKRA